MEKLGKQDFSWQWHDLENITRNKEKFLRANNEAGQYPIKWALHFMLNCLTKPCWTALKKTVKEPGSFESSHL